VPVTSLDASLTEQVFDDSAARKPDPLKVFEAWLEQARTTETNDPSAMSLATVDGEGLPDCRMVLLNGLDERGFVFFTNMQSAKGEELAARPAAALLFHWKSLRRQVRVRGPVEKVTEAESDGYFNRRPRGSRIGAHASQQSREVESRARLVAQVEAMTERFEDREVPRPDYWGGYRIKPVQIEFWLDGEYRLHNRVVYSRPEPGGAWSTRRLYP